MTNAESLLTLIRNLGAAVTIVDHGGRPAVALMLDRKSQGHADMLRDLIAEATGLKSVHSIIADGKVTTVPIKNNPRAK